MTTEERAALRGLLGGLGALTPDPGGQWTPEMIGHACALASLIPGILDSLDTTESRAVAAEERVRVYEELLREAGAHLDSGPCCHAVGAKIDAALAQPPVKP